MPIQVDEIRFSRRKRLAISVLPGGKVVVRAPLRTRTATIQSFIRDNEPWILVAKNKMSEIPQQVVYEFKEGEAIWYLGKTYPLHFVPKVRGGLSFEASKFFLMQTDQREKATSLLSAFYREETRRITAEFIHQYYQTSGLKPSAVRVTSARTRWGSCSGKNTISFSLRLAMTPLECLEYIVVHELSHIQHHNHSAKYWALVASLLPGFKQPQSWLKRNGLSLPILP